MSETRKWRPPKGPKNTPHKNKNTIGLGRTLEHAKIKKNQAYYLPSGEIQFSTEIHEPDHVKLQSVTQENPLDEFLNTAELQDKEFTAERNAGVKIVRINNQKVENTSYNPYLLSSIEEAEKFKIQQEHRRELTVPRRPEWDSDTTKFELDQKEKNAFLDWRRQLAMLQQDNDLLLTPFERNLNLWKQLWRVVERSDLIVQIVDARNPLLFRSSDLEKYVTELDPRKRNLLLVNKADLLTFSQRAAWGRYFKRRGIKYTFFSAAKANEILEEEAAAEAAALVAPAAKAATPVAKDITPSASAETPLRSPKIPTDDLSDLSLNDDEKEELARIKQELAQLEGAEDLNEQEEDADEDVKKMTKILTIDELEDLFLRSIPEQEAEESEEPEANGQPKRAQIGLVGYPNVGKSSTINALVGAKKVSVSSTPGKTKHYQTIILSDQVILCDCPGLVFPNFAYTNAELVCNGVLPIDQLRESTGPAELVCRRVPRYFLEAVYGIKIPTKLTEEGGSGVPSASEFLTAYAKARGYMTSGYGSADENRAARYILKDYVNGKLLYVEPPPHIDFSRASEAECKKFNEELYTIERLPPQRKQQVLSAIAEKGFSVDEFNLSTDLDKLALPSAIPEILPQKMSQRQKFDRTVVKEVDDEFFQMNNVRGVLDSPFHLKKSLPGGKRHEKKNRKMKKKGKA
ncbi:DEKNAAC104006 [Brettanomyces naardenensis]|uniref:DEKNAAC104006 n=1 Tax=Brettanomyces naardenensis TaxID=13370 RepID=A0A448YQ68_BRENA|nr:DEKNAAC104006 [Brettanomyces naardenensis]